MLDEAGGIQEICVFGDELASDASDPPLSREEEAILRHNLRAPLCSLITGTKALLRDDPLTDAQKEMLLEMRKVQDRLLVYLDISHDLDKIAKGDIKPTMKPVSLIPVVFDAIKQCRDTVQNRDIAVAVTLNGFSPGAGETFNILVDEKLCFLLLVNLITNALEAAPLGSSVDITLEDPATVRIHNSGAVPENIRDRFFEKFTTSGKRNGTGLGTYIAWQLAQAMGCELHMATSQERGTTLTLQCKPAP